MDQLTTLARDIDSTCRLTGNFTLRSGQQVPEYFDKYVFESQPELLRRVAAAVVPLLPEDTDLLGGLELGGVPIATMVSSPTGTPALFVRKAAKTYGTCRLAEGAEVAGRTVTLIEDVITTGGAVRAAALALRELGPACTPSSARSTGARRAVARSMTSPSPSGGVLTRDDLDRAHRSTAH